MAKLWQQLKDKLTTYIQNGYVGGPQDAAKDSYQSSFMPDSYAPPKSKAKSLGPKRRRKQQDADQSDDIFSKFDHFDRPRQHNKQKPRLHQSLFHEREIILRQGHKVHHIHLGPRLQKIAATCFGAFIMLLIGWGGSFTWGYLYQSHEIKAKEAAIYEGKVAYQAMMANIIEQREKLNANLTARLEAENTTNVDDSQQAISALSETLDDIIGRVSFDLEGNEALNNQIIKTRDELFDKVNDLGDELKAEKQARVQMAAALSSLNKLTGLEGFDTLDPDSASEMAVQQLDQFQSIFHFQSSLSTAFVDYLEIDRKKRQAVLQVTEVPLAELLNLVGYTPQAGGGGIELPMVSGEMLGLLETQAKIEGLLGKLQAMETLLTCLPLTPPVDHYNVSSRYGPRTHPVTGAKDTHKGLDMSGYPGIPIYAAAAATVTIAGRHPAYGQFVELDHGCNVKTRYGHMRSLNVKTGDKVEFRDRIGTLGSSGRSTGPHVHFEVIVNGRHVDPEPFIEAGKYVYKITEAATRGPDIPRPRQRAENDPS